MKEESTEEYAQRAIDEIKESMKVETDAIVKLALVYALVGVLWGFILSIPFAAFCAVYWLFKGIFCFVFRI